MAEENKEQVTEQQPRLLSVGQEKYETKALLGLARLYKGSFLQFAKEQGKFNDEQLLRLSTVIDGIANKMETTDDLSFDTMLGTMTDVSGTYGDGKESVQVQTRKGNIFRKSKYEDRDIHRWAMHFFSKLIPLLSTYKEPEKPEDTSKNWDINRGGFEAFMNGQGQSYSNIFSSYDIPAEGAETKPLQQRLLQLQQYISKYDEWLLNQGFDFTKDNNPFNDDFSTRLNNFRTFIAALDSNNLENVDFGQMRADLNYLGGGNYVDAFFSNLLSLTPQAPVSEEERLAKEEEERLKQQEAVRQQITDALYAAYEANGNKNYTFGAGKYYAPTHNEDTGKDLPFFSMIQALLENDKNGNANEWFGNYFSNPSKIWKANDPTWEKFFNDYASAFSKGTLASNINQGLLTGTLRMKLSKEIYNNSFMDFYPLDNQGNYLIRPFTNKNTGTGYIFNFYTGTITPMYLGDIISEDGMYNPEDTYRQNILRTLQQIYNKYAKDNNIDYNSAMKHETPIGIKEEGGIISNLQGGNFQYVDIDEASGLKARAQKHGNSTQRQKAKEKPMNSDRRSLEHPDAGWSATEKARLGTAAMDLASAIAAFIPGYGTVASGVLGVGSTLTNFGLDIADESISTWDATKGLVGGLAMDTVGLIPGFGSVGKGAKVIKTLVRFAPRIIATLHTVSAAPSVIASFNKLMDKDATLTSEDYRNLMTGLQIVLQGTAATARRYHTSKATKAAIKNNAAQVRLTDANGNTKDVVFEGNDLEIVKKLVAKKQAATDEAQIKAIDQSIEAFMKNHGYSGFTFSTSRQNFWSHPIDWARGKNKSVQFETAYDTSKLKGTNRFLAPEAETAQYTTAFSTRAAAARRLSQALKQGMQAGKDRRQQYDSQKPRRDEVERRYAQRENDLNLAGAEVPRLRTDITTARRQSANWASGRGINSIPEVKNANRELRLLQRSNLSLYNEAMNHINTGTRPTRRDVKDMYNKIKAQQKIIDDAVRTNIASNDARITGMQDRMNYLRQLQSRTPERWQRDRDYIASLNAHSPEYINARNAGISEQVLDNAGWWKSGGKIDKTKFTNHLNFYKI